MHPWMPALADDPYPWYAMLREHDPVHYSPSADAWFVSRYDDVLQVLRSPGEFSSSATLTPRLSDTRDGDGPAGPAGFMRGMPDPSRFLLTADPPDHTKLRRMVSKPFTPSAIAELEPRVRALSEELVDGLIAASERGEADLVGHLGSPLPLLVISHMLGIDAEHQDAFREWSNTMTMGALGDAGRPTGGGHMFEMMGYLAETIETRRLAPQDDLISALVTGAEPLSLQELLMFTVLLLIAGNETTTSLVGNTMLALWANPDELAKLGSDPALAPMLVEEALRYDSPVQALARHTTAAVDVAGTRIPGDQRVYVLYASANRDSRHFEDADRFMIERAPGDHIAFGNGIHFCLGASLARLEGRIAAETMLERVAAIRQAGEIVRKATPRHAGPALLRGVARLPVTIEAR